MAPRGVLLIQVELVMAVSLPSMHCLLCCLSTTPGDSCPLIGYPCMVKDTGTLSRLFGGSTARKRQGWDFIVVLFL